MLAARFRDALGEGEGGFGWEVIRIVWLYVGIGLSVVMMAPLHLVLYVVEGVMWRLGWRGSAEDKNLRGRRRDGNREGRWEGERRGRRREVRGGGREGRDACDGTKGFAVEGRAADRVEPREPLGVGFASPLAVQGDVGKAASSSEDDDVFFDAMGGVAEVAHVSRGDELGEGHVRTDEGKGGGEGSKDGVVEEAGGEEEQEEEGEETVAAENEEDVQPRRPEWAIPENPGRMEMGRFPANDFWELPKDDDMYSSFLKGN